MPTSVSKLSSDSGIALGLLVLCALLAASLVSGIMPWGMPVASQKTDAGISASPAYGYFPVGVLEDANLVAARSDRFEAMFADLQARDFDSLLFMNSFAHRDAPLLTIADRLNANVFVLPAGDLNDHWWPSAVPANVDMAELAAQPVVNLFGAHPSFRGYIVADEPGLKALDKTALISGAFHALDPARPAMPILIGLDRVRPIFNAAQPDVLLLDVYPVGYNNALCDFAMTGFGYPFLDLVSYIRAVTLSRPAGTPLWVILQTHRFGQGGPFSLREPAPAELSAQQWLAIGEGATGIFWFIYGSQQGWTGLADNDVLYPVATKLAGRLVRLRNLLLGLHKFDDEFTITGGKTPYASTLASGDSQKFYVVAVNRDCERAQMLSIKSSLFDGRLKDVESAQLYRLGEPIDFEPGDGKIFELVR